MNMITTKPDPDIEPGHQWIVLPGTEQGYALAELLTDGKVWNCATDGKNILIAHTGDVDARIVELINQLAHVRFSAPGLVQLTLTESLLPKVAFEVQE